MVRRVSWYSSTFGFSGLATGVTRRDDMLADAQTALGVASLDGYTITRIIGELTFRSGAVPGGDNVQEMGWGISIFDENLPAASLPSPITDNAPWMNVYAPLWVPWTVEASAGVFRQLMNVYRVDIRT